MGRYPCCEKVGLKKGPWTPEEDQKLLAYIEEHGHGSWRALPVRAGLQRCGKSCRLRWTNYLRPDIKRGKFSLQEEQTIIQLHALLGNRWSAIATHLPKRTDNEIKNYWNTHLKKRLTKMGIDPVTHKPKSGTLISSMDAQSKSNIANLSHMAQWESARLEAEARLVRESKIRVPSTPTQQQQQLDTVLLPQLHKKSAPSLDVIQAWKGVWPQSTSGSHGKIDLESPTSTLSFSSMQGLVDRNSTMCHQREERILQGDKVELKCLGKSISLLDAKDHTMPGFSVDTTLFGTEESSWLQESLSIRTGTGPSGGDFGPAGFTEMLLDNSDEQNSIADSDNADVGSCVEEEEDEDESSTYWNSILDLVNSPPPANSPPHLF